MGEQNVEANKSKQKMSPKLTAAEILPRRSTHSNTIPEEATSSTISDGYGDDSVEECYESKDGSINGLEPADGDEIDEVAEAKAMIAHLSQQLKATQAARVDQFGLENKLKRNTKEKSINKVF
ncbi:hypothetical protein BU17DRAFT_69816 [Hysterangium stoloniferum]|nr:hypothetical protein BU17DRAFT_69816 [Hysterangium stoloniferum]